MMKYYSIALLLSFVISLNASISQAQDASPQYFEGEITIYANSNNVWKVLTDTKKYAKFMGYKWKSGKKKVDTAGDQALLELRDEETAYELTFIEPGKKLAIKLESSTTQLINEKTWVVIPVDKWTTKVRVESLCAPPPDEAPPSAQNQINTWQNRLQKLRSIAERTFTF